MYICVPFHHFIANDKSNLVAVACNAVVNKELQMYVMPRIYMSIAIAQWASRDPRARDVTIDVGSVYYV